MGASSNYGNGKVVWKKPVFIDTCSNFNLEAELEMNREAYDNYRRAYIKIEQSEDIPFWQIVANRIKKEDR